MRKIELFKCRMELIRALSAALSLCFLTKGGFHDHRDTSVVLIHIKDSIFDLCVTY